MNKVILGLCCVVLLALSGCSKQQSDWEKTRTTNTTDAYEQFLKKYPSGEFTAQAQARAKELYEERDWQKARDTDTPEAYQAFLKQYPEGKWTEEARIRVENFTLAQAPANGTPTDNGTAAAPGASSPETVTDEPAATAPARAAPPSASAGRSAPSMKSQTNNAPPAPPVKASRASPSLKSQARGAASGNEFEKGVSHGVQLGAFKSSAAAANKRWEHLAKKYPKLFAGLSPDVARSKSSAGTIYRLRVVGLTEKRATEICRTLKADSQGCLLVRPHRH